MTYHAGERHQPQSLEFGFRLRDVDVVSRAWTFLNLVVNASLRITNPPQAGEVPNLVGLSLTCMFRDGMGDNNVIDTVWTLEPRSGALAVLDRTVGRTGFFIVGILSLRAWRTHTSSAF